LQRIPPGWLAWHPEKKTQAVKKLKQVTMKSPAHSLALLRSFCMSNLSEKMVGYNIRRLCKIRWAYWGNSFAMFSALVLSRTY
jgi:hypothetical protein